MELLTIEETAKLLRCSTRAIHKWTRKKEHPLPILYAGRKPLFEKDLVIEWLRTSPKRPAEEAE